MNWIRAAMSLVAVLAAVAAPGTALAAIDVSYSRTGGLVVNASTRANLELTNHEVDGVQGFDVRQIIGGVQNEDTIDGGDGCNETSLARVFCPVTNSRAVTVTLSDEELVFDSGLDHRRRPHRLRGPGRRPRVYRGHHGRRARRQRQPSRQQGARHPARRRRGRPAHPRQGQRHRRWWARRRSARRLELPTRREPGTLARPERRRRVQGRAQARDVVGYLRACVCQSW